MGIKALITIVSLLISACGSKIEPKIVHVDKTQKVQSTLNWETAEKLHFMWTPPKGPKGNDAKWIINDDIMLFTPDTPGEYVISLVIENMSGDILGEETFLLIAEDALNNSQHPVTTLTSTTLTQKTPKMDSATKVSPEIENAPNNRIENKVVNNSSYTIQVSAWPSLEEARKDQLSLIKYGIDAYTQRVFIDKKNSYWWRVRVGNFSTSDQASKVKKQIEDLRGSSVWVDIIDKN